MCILFSAYQKSFTFLTFCTEGNDPHAAQASTPASSIKWIVEIKNICKHVFCADTVKNIELPS